MEAGGCGAQTDKPERLAESPRLVCDLVVASVVSLGVLCIG